VNRPRLLVLLMAAAAGALGAQQPPMPLPGAPGITINPFDSAQRAQRARYAGDTTLPDSLRKPPKDLVKWAEPDSVMQSLMDRKGYTVTRYQGNEVVLQATRRDLQLDGHGAIERGQTVLVADTIFYSDSLKMMRATAPPLDTIVLRDPSQGYADMLAHGFLDYDLATHRGLAGSLSTSTHQAGNTWYVYGHQAAVVGDTTGQGHNTSFALDGSITSCDLVEPHYHFQATEIKVVSKTIMVARPAVLYVSDVPVLWLPFIFQDMRQGRRSGILTPRFGIADIIRTTPTYRRQIENVGYYFAINDYMDALVALDWRSGADAPVNDPGWTKIDAAYRFRVLDRFISSDIRTTYTWYTNQATRLDASFRLAQQFNQNSTINANLNYSSSTTLYRYDALTVAQALAAITSQLAYQDRFGPFALSIGGSRRQYAGQDEVDTDFPNFSVSSQPITIRPGVVWSPSMTVSNTMNQHLRGSLYNYGLSLADSVDSLLSNANQRFTSFDVNTPFRFGGFSLPLDFKVTDAEKDLEQNYLIYDFNTGKVIGQRTYARTFRTDANFETGFALPAFFGGSWNVTPFVAFVNADPAAGYWVRTEQTGGLWVAQSKTVQTGIGVQPTFYGFFPGFGPFSRIRHSIQPRLAFTYSPATNVSDAFLKALNQTRFGYLGGLTREAVTLQLLNTIEAKLKPRGADTTAVNTTGSDKIKLLNFNLSALTYDFVIAHKIGRGITTPTLNWDAQSDLLPGFQVSAAYSLFAGDPISDTAKFSPYQTNFSISFSIGRSNNPFAAFSRIFGTATPPDSGIASTVGSLAPNGSAFAQPPIAGPVAERIPLGGSTRTGWSLSIILTETKSRPVTGVNVRNFDPKVYCQQFINDPISYNQCLNTAVGPSDTLITTTAGAPVIITPPQTTLRAVSQFDLTPHWTVNWATGYDFVQHRFSDNVISLSRQLHDWHAVFAFTQAPNGNFAFNFFIALNAEPDLRFDYNRRNYRPITP
jgi:hypothetical protein